MQPVRPIETDIVLLGAGHAHVEVLRRFAMRPEPGVRLTLIGREAETPYSGMLPGFIRSEYSHQQVHIDLAPLAALAQARLILAEATAFDPVARTVTIAGRPDLPFDLLSIDIGGLPAVPEGGGVAVKPIGRFLDRLHRVEAELPSGSRIAVVGGGPGGVELALALAVRFAGQVRLVLVSGTPEPLANAPAAARRAVRRALAENRVELICDTMAAGWEAGRLWLSDGSFIEVAAAFWANGVEGPALLAESGVACGGATGRESASGGDWTGAEALAAAAQRVGDPGVGAWSGSWLAQWRHLARTCHLAVEGPDRSQLDAHVYRHADDAG
jgi:selenide,water dikinase